MNYRGGRNFDMGAAAQIRRTPRPEAFNPRQMPDQLIMAQALALAESNMVPFGFLVKLMQARNAPPQLRQTPRIYADKAGFTPFPLIETNPQRMSFIIANSNVSGENIFFSYGFPVSTPNGALAGIELAGGQSYQEANGTISMDDIYVWSDTPGGVILAYEGVLAIEGKHN